METEKLIGYFKDISAIPRASKDEKAVAEYIMNFARERELEAVQDEKGNVVVKKPAFGCETEETVILQGHMDMVYVKADDSDHCYEDGIIVKEKDGFLYAEGTSLGADNGVAIAYCMMLMDAKDLVHPNLEMIFTVEEEIGLTGAGALDVSNLRGKKFINLDSEDEGLFCVSCAGAVRAGFYWNKEMEELNCEEQMAELLIEIGGLKGGHSGMDINKDRANAIQLTGRILYELNNEGVDYRIGKIHSPGQANAIASHAKLWIYVKESQITAVKDQIMTLEKVFQNEYDGTDSLYIALKESEVSAGISVYEKSLNKRISDAIMMMPIGVVNYSAKVEGLVETSANIGILEEQGDRLYMLAAIRSAVDSKKFLVRDKMKIIAELYMDEVIFFNNYPGWEYKEESLIRDIICDTYKKVTGKDAQVEAVHAGLECGFFSYKNPEFDLISIGPDIFDVHSVKERASVNSMVSTWEFLKEVLKNI